MASRGRRPSALAPAGDKALPRHAVKRQGQPSSAPHEGLAPGRHQCWRTVVGQAAIAEGGIPREALAQDKERGLDGTATFQPDCSPPMSVVFTDVSACDTTNNGICCTLQR